MNVRECAYKILTESERSDKYISIALDAFISSHSVTGEDKALLCALVYGVTERRISLDYIISAFSGRKVFSLDKEQMFCYNMRTEQMFYIGGEIHGSRDIARGYE